MKLTTYALLGGLWFVLATAGLTLGIMADINQAAAPAFPLLPVLVTQYAINVAGIVLIKAIGVSQVSGYKWYMPFEGGQSFVIITAISLTLAINCMIGTAAYFFATFYIEPFYGLMSVQSFAVFVSQGMMLFALTLFKKDSPNQWHWLSTIASSPNRETTIVALLIVFVVIVTNVAEMRVSVRSTFAVVALLLHLGCGAVVHFVIGWKMTPNYRLFMPVPAGKISSALAQGVIWLTWTAVVQIFVALAVIPAQEAPPYAFVSGGLLSGLSTVSLIVFVRTFSEKMPRSASLLASHGLEVLTLCCFLLMAEVVVAGVVIDKPTFLPSFLLDALTATNQQQQDAARHQRSPIISIGSAPNDLSQSNSFAGPTVGGEYIDVGIDIKSLEDASSKEASVSFEEVFEAAAAGSEANKAGSQTEGTPRGDNKKKITKERKQSGEDDVRVRVDVCVDKLDSSNDKNRRGEKLPTELSSQQTPAEDTKESKKREEAIRLSPGATAAIEASQQISATFLIGVGPATHLLGSIINGHSYHTFQPFQGSVTFIVLQGLGWAIYSFALLFLILSLVIDREDEVHRMWLSTFAYSMMAAQLLLAASVRAFGTHRVERAERRRRRREEERAKKRQEKRKISGVSRDTSKDHDQVVMVVELPQILPAAAAGAATKAMHHRHRVRVVSPPLHRKGQE